jgi:hypothetical protein
MRPGSGEPKFVPRLRSTSMRQSSRPRASLHSYRIVRPIRGWQMACGNSGHMRHRSW